MDTQTQIDRLIELAIIQRSELKQLVEQLPQLREHLNAEVEKVFDETEPQLRAELEEWTTKQTADKTAALGVALEAKIADLAKSLEVSTQARYNAIIAERAENARLAAEAEAKIAEHAASLPGAVKEIVSAELARFPRAGEIDQLRKEFAEPKSLNPRGKWQAGETYNKLDLVTINGDSYTSNTDGNRTRPSRSSADWTLVAARGTGGGGGPTSLSELTTVPSDGDVLIGSGTSWVTSNLTAGAGISITVGPGAITISATDGDITLDDGTAASPSLHFTNDPDTGIYRPAANTLGISVSGTQVAYFDENGLTVPSAGVVAGGSIHAGNGNANNPSLSFDGDQDTGFFRHQPNEIGIALGGTQYATLTSTTFSITPVVTMASSLRVNGTTDSSSKDTGAIVTEGGLGVEKSATIGGNLTVSGTGTSTLAGQVTSFANAGNASNLGSFVASNATLNSFTSYSPSASLDQKYWTLQAGTAVGDGVIRLRALNDAGTNGTNALIITRTGISSTAVEVGGNLTVSGTGNSSFAGSLRVSAATAISKLTVGDTSNTFSTFIFGNNSANGIAFGTGGTGVPVINGYNNTFAATQTIAVQPNGGNLLLGTTTDSANGKLQLATHTDKTGGIGFGTDVSLYRTAAGAITVSSDGVSFTTFTPSGTYQQQIYRSGADAQFRLTRGGVRDWDLVGGSTFQIKVDSTTALTLDSSLNATFAGNVTAVKAGTAFYSIESTVNGALSEVIVKGKNSVGTAREARLGLNKYADDVFSIYDGTTERFRLGLTNGNATFAGTITANGASVVSTLSASGTTVTGFDVTNGAAAAVNNATRVIFRNNNAFSGAFVSGEIKSVTPAANNTSNLVFSAYEKDNGLLTALTLTPSGTSVSAAFNGAISINNTVQTAASVASTHKVTISIGGTTYYLLATNV